MIWSACMIGADALGDDDHRRVGRLLLERRAQPGVGREVERREAVVEDLDPGLLGERPGDGEALALPAGDVGAALVDQRLEPLGHLAHELAALGDLEEVPELLVGGLLVAVAQVVGHRAAEQERLLRHEADPVPQVLQRHLAHVDAVHERRCRR